MNVRKWFVARGPRFIIQRANSLLSRYGITPSKAIARIDDSLITLSRYGCAPTFPTPGIIVQRYSQFFQRIQAEGAEIAVHSFQHVDLNSLKLNAAREQLNRAALIFIDNDINVHGFRCPYLSCSEELLDSLPEGLFDYSSNQAIWLDVPQLSQNKGQSVIFKTLRRFYNPKPFTEAICVPYSRSNMIEIPVCVPDDLQLHDGLNLDSQGVSQAWIEMLHQTYHRGELFNLIFHPELGSACKRSFDDLLMQAIMLKPTVWFAKLREICDWWKEKSAFRVNVFHNSDALLLNFSCSPRATILVRGLGSFGSEDVWEGAYYQLQTKNLTLPDGRRPFVGIDSNAPTWVISFLKEQGYIVEISDNASSYETYIDADTLSRLGSEVKIIDYIENSNSPLVRYWRWPNGAKSALSITGDLDALTLNDYVSRLFIH